MKKKRILYYLKNPGKMIMPLGDKGFFNWIPDRAYLSLLFRGQFHKKLNFANPQTYNEKLQWLKLNDRKPLYHTIVDKYEVKSYVASKIGSQYVIPTLGVWDNPDEIDFESLPQKFVLKCTHDSGSTIVCHNKDLLDIKMVKKKLNGCLKRSTFWFGREWPYKDLKPRVIAEQLLESESENGLDDYKVLCFHGEPKLIEVHSGRYTTHHTMEYYDTNWQRKDIQQTRYQMAEIPQMMPSPLAEMLELSAELSKDFIHIRVDWYIIKSQLFFGELTFYDASGLVSFKDEKWDYEFGSWINLPKSEI